jgi:hypothetical protein
LQILKHGFSKIAAGGRINFGDTEIVFGTIASNIGNIRFE